MSAGEPRPPDPDPPPARTTRPVHGIPMLGEWGESLRVRNFYPKREGRHRWDKSHQTQGLIRPRVPQTAGFARIAVRGRRWTFPDGQGDTPVGTLPAYALGEPRGPQHEHE